MNRNHDCVVQESIYRSYFRWRVPKLFKYADRGHWEKIPQRALRHPAECKFVHRYAPGDTALHRLVRPLSTNKADEKCNKVHLEEESEAKSPSQDNEDEACILELLLPAIRAILKAHPEAATIPDKTFGRTPLHLACQSLTPHRIQAVQLLLENSSPQQRLSLDSRGRTPLHYLVENETVPMELVQAFVQNDPQVVNLCDANNQTVLDLVRERHENGDKASESLLLEALQKTVALPGGTGTP